MRKIRATVISIFTAILVSIISLIPYANAAATINLDQYPSEPLSTMLNGNEDGPIWTGSIAGAIDYDFTGSAYDENVTEGKTIIYVFFLDNCSRCKNFYKFIATDLLPNYADKFIVKSYPLPYNFELLNALAKHYGTLPDNGNYSTPIVIVGKTFSTGGVDQARQDEIKAILDSGGSTYDAVERINSGYATPDATTQTQLSSRNISMKCGTPVDSEYKLEATEIDRSNLTLEGYDYINANDISAYRYGKYVPITNNQLEITIPVDKEYKNYRVAYIEDGAIKETFDAQYTNGKVTFTTSHLSEYAVYGTNNADVSTLAPAGSTNKDSSTNKNTAAAIPANPNTADSIILYGIVLAVSIITLGGSILTYRKIAKL